MLYVKPVVTIKVYDIQRFTSYGETWYRPVWRWIDEIQWRAIKDSPKFPTSQEAKFWISQWADKHGLLQP